jgi:hypothetical protein
MAEKNSFHSALKTGLDCRIPTAQRTNQIAPFSFKTSLRSIVAAYIYLAPRERTLRNPIQSSKIFTYLKFPYFFMTILPLFVFCKITPSLYQVMVGDGDPVTTHFKTLFSPISVVSLKRLVLIVGAEN